MNDECSSCRYFYRMNTEGGECRRNPPKVFDRPGQWVDEISLWPVVNDYDWCGEHQPNP